MTARGVETQLSVLIIAGTALLLSPWARSALPEQFLLDEQHLIRTMTGPTVGEDAVSFVRVAALYSAIGLDRSPELAALLGVAVFTVGILGVLGWERLRELSLLELAAVGASFVLALVYLAQYSKELFTLVLVLIVLRAPPGRRGDAGILLLCLVYAATLRPYWVIVAALYLCWRVLLPLVRRPAALLVVPVLAYIALTPAFAIVLGSTLQEKREWANAERGGSDAAASFIQSPIPDSAGLLGVLSALVMLVLLVVPLQLLLSGSAYHAASGLLILGIWCMALAPVARGRLLAPREPAAPRDAEGRGARTRGTGATGAGAIGARATGPGAVLRLRAVRSAALLLSLLLTQALFEPDYGSYLKHLTPMLPLVIALLPTAMRPMPGSWVHPDPIPRTGFSPPMTIDRSRLAVSASAPTPGGPR